MVDPSALCGFAALRESDFLAAAGISVAKLSHAKAQSRKGMLNASNPRHPEPFDYAQDRPISGSMVLQSSALGGLPRGWMLKQVQHDGWGVQHDDSLGMTGAYA